LSSISIAEGSAHRPERDVGFGPKFCGTDGKPTVLREVDACSRDEISNPINTITNDNPHPSP
jgi:hypothetical protein